MKNLIVILILSFSTIAFGQSNERNETIKKLPNGQIKIESVDPLGANVMVIYDKNQKKVYQERTDAEVTTFAKYENGVLAEYGTLQRTQAYSGK